MSYSTAVNDRLFRQTGAQDPEIGAPSAATFNLWSGLWCEVFRSRQAIDAFPHSSSTGAISFGVETLPVFTLSGVGGSAAALLGMVEKLFGDSATDLAKMLRVSRPMVYHYREGMEPSVENRRRLLMLAMLASEWSTLENEPLKSALRTPQPGGHTLLELLCDERLDTEGLRQILWRNVQASDQVVRAKLADALAKNESIVARADVMRERHAEGKSVFAGDRESPGKLIQIQPDGSRVRGRLVKRKFIPDEE